MSWLSSGWHWLGKVDSNGVTAAGTIISAVGGIVVAGATYWLGRLTKTLATESRLTRETNEAANMQCAIEPHEKSLSLLELVIVNVGNASANNVVVRIERGGRFQNLERPDFQYSNFLPRASSRVFVGSFLQMEDKTIEVSITFSDKFGERVFRYEQDLTKWSNITRLGDPPLIEIASYLKKISESLGRWNVNGRLNVDMFSASDRKQAEEAYQEEIRDRSGGVGWIDDVTQPKQHSGNSPDGRT